MADRASIAQVVQIGVETTPGTGVAANKQLLAVSIEPAIQANLRTFRPMGSKFPTITVLGKEWVEASIEGPGVYTDIVYLLSSAMNYAAPVQQGATTAYKWTFSPSQASEDTIKTFTVEQGSGVRAHKFTYGLVNEFKLAWDRDEITISGSMLGQALQDGITLTSSPTAIELVPMLPIDMDIYMDTASGGLGTTKLLRVLSGEFTLGDRFSPLWAINSAVGGFAAHVETEPNCELKLLVEADAAGMALLDAMRAGSKRFIRVKVTGDEIATPYNYLFQLDFCGEVSDVSDFNDEDGVYAIEWTFKAIHDSAWGKAFTLDVINKLTAL